MKKWLFPVLSLILVLSLAACGTKKTEEGTGAQTPAAGGNTTTPVTVKVAATAVPHAEILEFIKPKLKEQGVNLEVKVFTDYVQPNVQVFEKQFDANFFQHVPYLDQFNKDKNMNLVKVAGVHIEPFGVYSKKVKKLEEVKDGAQVAIPNDPTNGGRALALLAKSGLIKLKDGVGVNGTVKDIVENKKNLKIKELEAAMLPRVLDEVELALINTNYALEAKLNPTKDAIVLEDKNSPYVNILVSRPDNKDSEGIKKLVAALNTPEVKKFIEDKYAGAVVPAF